MIIYSNFNLKILFSFLLIILIGLPVNNFLDFIFLITTLFIISFFQKKNTLLTKLPTLILILLVLSSSLIKQKNIQEAHSIFFSKKDISVIANFLPNKIIENIKKDYDKIFDTERALKSFGSNHFPNEDNFNNFVFIDYQYAFSSDDIFKKSKYTRKTNFINFNSREDLRIEQVNTLDFNLVFDKELRRELPYYVYYEIPKSYYKSKICGKGNIYFTFIKSKEYQVKDLNFKKLQSECIIHTKINHTLLIIGYSINKTDNLEINLEKNSVNLLIFYLLILIKIIFIIYFTKVFFEMKKFSKKDISIFFLTVFSTFLYIYFKDLNLLFGLRYYRGGGDGLFHEFQAYEIVKHIYKYEFREVLKGGEGIFYFMPGLRYLLAVNKIIFGSTAFGYILLTILLPIFLYKLLKNLISEKIAFYLILSFLFIPIFENLGFGYFNYIHQLVRNHAETFSITIIVLCLYKISNKNFIEKLNPLSTFFFCFLLALAIFCRPNFLPTTSLIFFYLLKHSLTRDYRLSAAALFGYSFIFFSFFHNLYFGNQFVLFTKSNVHFAFNDIFQTLNSVNEENIILSQLSKWNPIYNIHRLLILIFIFYSFFKQQKNLFVWLLISCTVLQHLVLLLTHPDSRYAYLAWLLTFILFVYYLFNFYLKKLK